jgi:putative peptide zinc metalloprotease protein
VLADWLEIPNLREKANRYLQRLCMEYCLGIEAQPEPYMDPLRRVLFLTYAIVSYVYRWFVTFVIIYFMATFLKPYKLQVLSEVLTLFAVGSMVGWPVYRLLQNVHKRGRLPDMKFVNASISATALAALLLGFFLVPLPISRIRETGVVQLQPQASSRVPIVVGGILNKIHVREGEVVRQGKILAEFKNQEVLAELEAAQTRYRIQDEIIQALNAKIPSAKGKPELAQKLQNDLVLSREEKNKAELEWQQWQEKADKLILRAPCDGVAIGVPKRDEIGKRWEKDKAEAFCTIGDPEKLQVLLPISPDDQQLLREDLLRANQEKRTLDVTIRVQGLGARTWSGVVPLAELPTAAAKEIPVQLSTKGGGPLAVKPGAENEKELIPQVQVYLVPIHFTDPDPVLVPGALAQVKIHCEYRSAAWWVWRSISKTFDLGLI